MHQPCYCRTCLLFCYYTNLCIKAFHPKLRLQIMKFALKRAVFSISAGNIHKPSPSAAPLHCSSFGGDSTFGAMDFSFLSLQDWIPVRLLS